MEQGKGSTSSSISNENKKQQQDASTKVEKAINVEKGKQQKKLSESKGEREIIDITLTPPRKKENDIETPPRSNPEHAALKKASDQEQIEVKRP
eukprot:3790010-Prorocentrum_lima.AAC.1